MSRSCFLAGLLRLTPLLILAGCGGGGSGGGGDQVPASVTVSTLAYVVTECSGDTMRQSLQIRQGEQPPIPVVEYSAAVPLFNCLGAGLIRQGPAFAELGVFRRLGVTPDASQICFRSD